MNNKNCIFCGQLPKEKNKEHILPKWLLKLTGNEGRTVNIGYNWESQQNLNFSLASFTFPSCEKCNSDFSKIESKVRLIVEKLTEDQHVNYEELNLLLDWLDKIRIGVWLSVNYLNKNTFQIDPKFYINDRVGLKDRFLSITNLYNNHKGLTWIGANSPCFIYSPTCLSFQINNLLFLNVSYEFAVSEHLGFPYPKFTQPKPDTGLTDYHLLKATERFTKYPFKTRIPEPSIKILQPIYKQGIYMQPEYYNIDYVVNNSYDFNSGLGKIFIEHDNLLYPLEKDEEINFEMKDKIRDGQPVKIIEATLGLQIELLDKYKTDLTYLTDEQRHNYREVKKTLTTYSKKYLELYRKERKHYR